MFAICSINDYDKSFRLSNKLKDGPTDKLNAMFATYSINGCPINYYDMPTEQ